jgi:hypothetical protein
MYAARRAYWGRDGGRTAAAVPSNALVLESFGVDRWRFRDELLREVAVGPPEGR